MPNPCHAMEAVAKALGVDGNDPAAVLKAVERLASTNKELAATNKELAGNADNSLFEKRDNGQTSPFTSRRRTKMIIMPMTS